MGNSVDTLQPSLTATPPAPNWAVFQDPSLHSFLSSDHVFKHANAKALCKTLFAQPASFWSLCDQIPHTTDLLYTANLLHVLRVFVAYVFANHHSYDFLYESQSEAISTVRRDDFAFSRQVRCLFQWQGVTKSLLISVPQSHSYDAKAEFSQIASQVINSFDSLRDLIKATKQHLVLFSESGNLLEIADIVSFYTKNRPQDRIINPFAQDMAEEPQKYMTIVVKTSESKDYLGTLAGPMAAFLQRLVDFYIGLQGESEEVLKVKQALTAFLVTLLSSQMYYLRPRQSDTKYSDFVHSPAMDILMSIDRPGLIVALLKDFIESSRVQIAVPGFFALLLGANKPTLTELTHIDLRNTALILALLSLCMINHFPNPYIAYDLLSITPQLTLTLLDSLQDTRKLLLLYTLLRQNTDFRNYFQANPSRNTCILELCRYLHSAKPGHSHSHLTLVLSILLLLSENSQLVQSLSTEGKLDAVPWLSNYQTKGIAISSIMFLAGLHLIRENLALRNGYIQVLVTGLLFNLAMGMVDMHEYAAQVFLSTIKSLWLLSSKPGEDRKLVEAREMLQVLTDLLAIQLLSALPKASWLVYMTLHEADSFTHMSTYCPGTAAYFQELITKLLPHTEGDSAFTTVSRELHTLKLDTHPHLQVFQGAQSFLLREDSERFEAWAVPYVWMEAAKTGLSALKFEAELSYSKLD